MTLKHCPVLQLLDCGSVRVYSWHLSHPGFISKLISCPIWYTTRTHKHKHTDIISLYQLIIIVDVVMTYADDGVQFLHSHLLGSLHSRCNLLLMLQFNRHISTSTLTLWRPLLPVLDRVKPPFVIFDIRALWRSRLSVRVPGCQKLQMTA